MTTPSPPVDSLPTTRGRCPFDPPATLGVLREHRPLSRLAYPDGPIGWLVTDDVTARAVLTDDRFSARQDLRLSPVRERPVAVIPPAAPGVFLGMDPPEHTRYRRALSSLFAVRRIDLLAPTVERVVAQHLDALGRSGSPVDLVPTLAVPVPVAVSSALLGLTDDAAAQVLAAAVVRDDLRRDEAERVTASETIYRCALDLVADDAPDGAVAALRAAGLSDVETTVVVYLLLVTGQEPMATMLAYGVYALLCHPDQWDALCAEPALVDRAVDELLRYLTIAQHGTVRTAVADVELAGQRIRAGEPVTVSLAAANRDPRRFPDPDTLDITRPVRGHVAFGHGVHHCLGHRLARMQLRVCYRALAERFPSLRLAVPATDVPLRHGRDTFGVEALPVRW